MKFLAKFFIGLILLIVAAVALVIGLPWIPAMKDQVGSKQYVEYLEQNAQPFSLTESGGGVTFDQDFYDSRVIILGEMHGFQMPQQIDFAVMENLHGEVPYLTYMAELSPAQAIVLNEYVAGGPDDDVRRIFDLWAEETAQWANKEFFEKLARIRTFNQDKTEDEKIWFVGIDRIQNQGFADEIAARRGSGVAPSFNNLEGVQAINEDLLAATMAQEAGVARYTTILANLRLLAEVERAEEQTFYGLWGISHAGKTSVNGYKSLGQYLNELDWLFQGKVGVIQTMCVGDCYNMMPGAQMPGPFAGPNGEPYTWVPIRYDSAMIWRLRGIGDAMAAAGDRPATLFRADADGTPYVEGPRMMKTSGYLAMANPYEFDGAFADTVDYFVLMQNSPGLNPWVGDVYDITRQGNHQQ